MRAKLFIHEDEPPIEVESVAEMEALIGEAVSEASRLKRPNIVIVAAANGNEVSFVLDEPDTVLGFTFGHGAPPYYVSKGVAESIDPVFTAYVSLPHHTEYPRRAVVPWSDGLRAVLEFVESGGLPTVIKWEQV
jgi:hypothetical protein